MTWWMLVGRRHLPASAPAWPPATASWRGSGTTGTGAVSFVKPITGRGITTSVGMEAADLGIPRWDAQRGANAVMFGDNFTHWGMTGDWQSPSIVMYDDNYDVLGIPTHTGIASEGHRRQLWPYEHNNAEFSTILPCDFIKVGGMWYVAAMVTAGLGNELRTVFGQSKNLIDWEKTDPVAAGASRRASRRRHAHLRPDRPTAAARSAPTGCAVTGRCGCGACPPPLPPPAGRAVGIRRAGLGVGQPERQTPRSCTAATASSVSERFRATACSVSSNCWTPTARPL